MGEEKPEKEIEEALFIFLQVCMDHLKVVVTKEIDSEKMKQKHKTKQKLSTMIWKLK